MPLRLQAYPACLHPCSFLAQSSSATVVAAGSATPKCTWVLHSLRELAPLTCFASGDIVMSVGGTFCAAPCCALSWFTFFLMASNVCASTCTPKQVGQLSNPVEVCCMSNRSLSSLQGRHPFHRRYAHISCADFATNLQSQAGPLLMQAKAGSVISLPLGYCFMGLPLYGRQLYVRPVYLQLKDRILQLRQGSNAREYGCKCVIVSGTPGIGKSFCASYLASYWIAEGKRVIYEFHDQREPASIEWYHFPPNSGECICISNEHEARPLVKDATDANTVYIVDGALPHVPAPPCWGYAFASPTKSVFRFKNKLSSCHLMYLPLWPPEELEQCRESVDTFSSVSRESVANAFAIAGGVPRTVLQLLAEPTSVGITGQSIIINKLETAVNTLPSEVTRCCLLLFA